MARFHEAASTRGQNAPEFIFPITFHSKKHIGDQRSARIRLRAALRGFRRRILAVHLRVVDVNGPKGGADKQCRVVAHIHRAPSVVVEYVASDVTTSILQAVKRALRAIVRRLKRGTGRPTRDNRWGRRSRCGHHQRIGETGAHPGGTRRAHRPPGGREPASPHNGGTAGG